MTIVTMMRMDDVRLFIDWSCEHLIRIFFSLFLSYIFTRYYILSRMMTMNKTHAIKDNSRTSLHKYTHQSSSQSIHFSLSFSLFYVIRRQRLLLLLILLLILNRMLYETRSVGGIFYLYSVLSSCTDDDDDRKQQKKKKRKIVLSITS